MLPVLPPTPLIRGSPSAEMSTGLAAAAYRHRPGSASPARRTRSGGEGGRRGCDGGQRRALTPSSVSWALFVVHRSTSLPRLHACDCRFTTRTVDAWWPHHLPQAAAREEVRRGCRLPIRLHLEAHVRFRWLRCPRARTLYIDRGRENTQESEEAPAARAPPARRLTRALCILSSVTFDSLKAWRGCSVWSAARRPAGVSDGRGRQCRTGARHAVRCRGAARIRSGARRFGWCAQQVRGRHSGEPATRDLTFAGVTCVSGRL